jgi:AcrR family transcriptional regulator
MERKRIESPRTPGRPRSDEAHEAILDAALAVLRDVGLDGVTMEGVAARAGVGKATVYRRWSSKEAMVTEAVARIVETLPVPDTGDTDSDVLALMLDSAELYRDPATVPLLSGLVAAMVRSPSIASAVLSGFHAIRRDALLAILTRGITRGDLPAHTDVGLAIDLLNGPLFYRALWTGEPVDEPFTGAAVRAVLRGLRGTP